MLTPTAATRLHRQLTELGELLAYAHLALLPGSAPRGGRVSGATRSAPLPLRLDVLSLLGPAGNRTVRDPYGDQHGLTPVIGTLTAWARVVEEEHPCSSRPGRQHTCRADETTIGSLLAYLTARDVLAWSVQQMWADEYAAEINAVWRALQPFAMLRPRRQPLPQLPCPRCDLLSLVREDGRDVECTTPGCGVILRQGEVDDRAQRILDELDAAA
jgi:hypothetical protein